MPGPWPSSLAIKALFSTRRPPPSNLGELLKAFVLGSFTPALPELHLFLSRVHIHRGVSFKEVPFAVGA